MEHPYVQPDGSGALRVGDTHVMLDGVVIGFHEGLSAEAIQQQYPTLTLEQVYGALAWCLANGEQVEAYMRRQDAAWAKWKKQADVPAVVQRLRSQQRRRGADIA